MGYRTVGIPTPYIHSVGNRATIQQYGVVRPPLFSKLIQWACGDPTTLDDGTVIVEDKKGDSGLADGRSGQPAGSLKGDGTRFVQFSDLDYELDPSVDDFYIMVEANLTNTSGTIIANATDTPTDRVFQIFTSPTSIFVRLNGIANEYVVTPSTVTKIEVEGVGGTVSLKFNGVTQTAPTVGPTKTTYDKWALLARSVTTTSTFIGEHELYEVNIDNQAILYFQDSNNNTYCYDASGNDNHGEIQNATGDDRGSSTNRESDMDLNGYSVARALGKNLFNKDNIINNFYVDVNGDFVSASGWYSYDSYVLGLGSDLVFTSITDSTLAHVAFLDSEKNLISSVSNDIVDSNSGHIEKPSNAVFVRYSSLESLTPKNSFQLEEGTTATTYEAWEGYYRDEALTDPVSDGELSPNINGKSVWWISDGAGGAVKSDSDFTGLLKADLRVVDGVVDNGVDYENWGEGELDAGITVEDDGIVWEGDASFQAIRINTNLKDDTEYTFVFEVESTNVTVANVMALPGQGVNEAFASVDVTTLGEKRTTITTKNPIVDQFFRVATNGLPVGETFKIVNVAIYEGDYVTGSPPLPTTGQPNVGNSVIQATTRYDLIQADDLTTTDMYDTTDVDNAEALVVPLTGDVSDNPLFIREDPFCWLLYGETLNASEEQEVEEFLNF